MSKTISVDEKLGKLIARLITTGVQVEHNTLTSRQKTKALIVADLFLAAKDGCAVTLERIDVYEDSKGQDHHGKGSAEGLQTG